MTAKMQWLKREGKVRYEYRFQAFVLLDFPYAKWVYLKPIIYRSMSDPNDVQLTLET